jgi:hypothetical protein
MGVRVQAVTSSDPTEFLYVVNAQQYVGGSNAGHWMKHGVAPTAADLRSTLVDVCLPWFAERSTPDAIVGHWMRSPGSHAPWPLWEKIELAAQWGKRDEAVALLRLGYLEEPQHADKFTAVAERFGLSSDWESLAAYPPAQEN